MSRKWILGIVMAAGVAAAMALGVVQSGAVKNGSDLSGQWRLDPAKSDMPAMGRGRGGPGRGEGRFRGRFGAGAEREPGQGPERPRGGRGRRLPAFFQVTQQAGTVSFADSAGSFVQEIHLGAAAPGAGSTDPGNGVRELTGRWENGTLIAETSGPWGGTLVQRYKLEDHGKTLVVRTERMRPSGSDAPGAGDRPGRSNRGEIKMVYRRAS